MEAFHFASVVGDPTLLAKVKPSFVVQLDALGWSLSYEHHNYAAAAEAFEQALCWDPKDDYAHHYLAFNLDRDGRRLEEVEQHYREAVALKPRHAWWWSRLICFLIGRGRVGEARNEWNDALLELGLAEGDASLSTYQHLHCWVAGALLEAGEVVFAREVLDDVPLWAQAELEHYAGLSQRADALLQLGDGDAVVPARRLRPEWWLDPPELLQFRFATGEERVRWQAARVEEKDDEGIHLRGAIIERGEEKPGIVWSVLSPERFDEDCRDEVSARDLKVGSFLELGLYALPKGGKVRTVIRVLSEQSWGAGEPSALRPNRYLTDFVSQQR
jgi:tetratricopeptide (TPR) repeat protein